MDEWTPKLPEELVDVHNEIAHDLRHLADEATRLTVEWFDERYAVTVAVMARREIAKRYLRADVCSVTGGGTRSVKLSSEIPFVDPWNPRRTHKCRSAIITVGLSGGWEVAGEPLAGRPGPGGEVATFAEAFDIALELIDQSDEVSE